MGADTYYYMAENPRSREFGLAGFDVEYRARDFDPPTYCRSVGRWFDDDARSYEDWMLRGRTEGAEWAPGRDTLLKIVLKAKDEPELIDAWVSHHARIVGYDNIVILDCGSVDPVYLAKLKYYSEKLVVLKYGRYYDHIHSTRSNHAFFQLLARNCRYLTVLDADEFLVARQGDVLSPRFVKSLLRSADERVICGTWLNGAVESLAGPSEQIEMKVDISDTMLRNGTVAGKSIARFDQIFAIGHLGHNLHVQEVMARLSGGSFGALFVMHLKYPGREVGMRRILSHLIAKGAIESHGQGDLRQQLIPLLEEGTRPDIRGYALRLSEFLDGRGEISTVDAAAAVKSRVLAGIDDFFPGFGARVDAFDFSGLLRERFEER